MTTTHIGFIGGGNMAHCIISGLCRAGTTPADITVSDKNSEKLAALKAALGVNITEDNVSLLEKADVLVLAVKPQAMHTMLEPLAPLIQQKKPLIITIAAGLSMNFYQTLLGQACPIIRMMPNTPSFVQAGVSGLYANHAVTTHQQSFTDHFAQAIGESVWVENEAMLEALTTVSGCGPAYFYLFTELLAKQAQQLGFDEETAHLLARKTFEGAAQLATSQPQETVSHLKQQVTSPNGVTERALSVLEQTGLEKTIAAALKGALARSAELNQSSF